MTQNLSLLWSDKARAVYEKNTDITIDDVVEALGANNYRWLHRRLKKEGTTLKKIRNEIITKNEYISTIEKKIDEKNDTEKLNDMKRKTERMKESIQSLPPIEITEELLHHVFLKALDNCQSNSERIKLLSIGVQFLDKKNSLKQATQSIDEEDAFNYAEKRREIFGDISE